MRVTDWTRHLYIAPSSHQGWMRRSSAAADVDFLLEKAVASYCDFMAQQNPKLMTTYERGLYEGMALDFVMGHHPEQGDVFANLEDQAFEKGFYGWIREVCPAKSFL
ncbi:MAG: hypothetical protein ACKOZW_05040 [Cyanobium sp.]